MAVPIERLSGKVLPSPEVLRRNVFEQLSRLPDEGVLVLHELARELELKAAWEEFSEGMARDWAEGKYEGLDEALNLESPARSMLYTLRKAANVIL